MGAKDDRVPGRVPGRTHDHHGPLSRDEFRRFLDEWGDAVVINPGVADNGMTTKKAELTPFRPAPLKSEQVSAALKNSLAPHILSASNLADMKAAAEWRVLFESMSPGQVLTIAFEPGSDDAAMERIVDAVTAVGRSFGLEVDTVDRRDIE